MKEKGFTLIEVLTVLIVLGVVVMIAMPVVEGIIKDSQQKTYISQLKGIRESAKMWTSEHIFEAPRRENESKVLNLEELIEGGYVEKNIKNPKTRKPFENVKVMITYEGGLLKYTVYENNQIINFD